MTCSHGLYIGVCAEDNCARIWQRMKEGLRVEREQGEAKARMKETCQCPQCRGMKLALNAFDRELLAGMAVGV